MIVRQTLPAVALLVLAAVAHRCQSNRWSAERAALLERTARAESLTAVNRALSKAAESRADSLGTVAALAQISASQAIGEADRLRAQRRALVAAAGRVGDSASALPPVAETGTDSALTLCELETDALRDAISASAESMAAQTQQVAELRGALSRERQSSDTLGAVVRRLEVALMAADPPCRVLLWRCPSRRVAFAGGALTALIAAEVIRRE